MMSVCLAPFKFCFPWVSAAGFGYSINLKVRMQLSARVNLRYLIEYLPAWFVNHWLSKTCRRLRRIWIQLVEKSLLTRVILPGLGFWFHKNDEKLIYPKICDMVDTNHRVLLHLVDMWAYVHIPMFEIQELKATQDKISGSISAQVAT